MSQLSEREVRAAEQLAAAMDGLTPIQALGLMMGNVCAIIVLMAPSERASMAKYVSASVERWVDHGITVRGERIADEIRRGEA